MSESAITLLEILVVIIITGILAALGLANFGGAREQALNREAIANLKLIAAAERIYRLEYTWYFGPANDVVAINNYLKLSLSRKNWNYDITRPTQQTFNITAARATGSGTVFFLNQTPGAEPTCTGPTCY